MYSSYERHRPIISGKKLYGYDVSTYCKISETYIDDPIQYKCDFAFGTGLKKFCMISKYDVKNPDSIYIDRVENNTSCLLEKGDINERTVKLVRIGLYEMLRLKPSITRFTLKDDSNIYCNGSTGERISMSYESLLKYNQTWYQQKFGAILPGFVSSTTKFLEEPLVDGIIQITIPINGVPTTFFVKTESSMFYFLQSLSNMDRPSTPYESIIQEIPRIASFQNEYESANTPREFMANVRAKYTNPNGKLNKKEYCYAVAPWFSFYINALRIPLYYDQWYIPASIVIKPDEFKEEPMEQTNVIHTLHGGHRITRSKPRSSIRRGSRRRIDQWGVIPYYPIDSRFGGADDI